MNLMNYATAAAQAQAQAQAQANTNISEYDEKLKLKQEQFCVSWLPDGKAFVVYDIKEFTNTVLPKFFKASKYCSFTRKCTSFNCCCAFDYCIDSHD